MQAVALNPLNPPRAQREKGKKLGPHVLLGMWVLFLTLFPFYVLPSGLPQPADYIMALLMLVVFLRGRSQIAKSGRATVMGFLAFAWYACVVDVTWAVLLNDIGPVQFAVFYIYNALVLVAFLMLYGELGRPLMKATLYGVAIAVALEVVLAFVGGGSRAEGTFNNPNQLGYFALLSGTIFIAGSENTRTPRILHMIIYVGVATLTVLSLSKAAMVSCVVLFMLGMRKRPATILIAAIGIGAVLLVMQKDVDMISRIQDRFSEIQTDDNAQARGYDRIATDPQYLVLGAGEGAYYRFPLSNMKELHSSIGTLIFCYGIIGTLIFALALIPIARHGGLLQFMYFVPAFGYGITHQGLRFTYLWVLIAFLAACTEEDKSKRDPGRGGTQGSAAR